MSTTVSRSVGKVVRARGAARVKGQMQMSLDRDTVDRDSRSLQMPMPLPSWQVLTPPRPMAVTHRVDTNAQLIGRVNVSVAQAHERLGQIQSMGHQLTQGDLTAILDTLKNTAVEIERMGQEASRSRNVSLDAMAHVRSTLQDLYNASTMYYGMANGQALMAAQTQMNQLRGALAAAQMNYSNVAGIAERRAGSMHTGETGWDSWTASFGPVQMPAVSSGMGTPVGMPGTMPTGLPPGGAMMPNLPAALPAMPSVRVNVPLPPAAEVGAEVGAEVAETSRPGQLRLPIPGMPFQR